MEHEPRDAFQLGSQTLASSSFDYLTFDHARIIERIHSLGKYLRDLPFSTRE